MHFPIAPKPGKRHVGAVDHLAYQSRRATPEDVPALQALWQRADLPWNELENFIDEFVVVPGPEGILIGALGVMVEGHEALLHSEALLVSEDADEVREVMWKRLQNLARVGGARRIWTQEDSLYWQTLGFSKVTPEALAEAKTTFLDPTAEWLSLQLFDPEKAQEIIKEKLAVWETQRMEEVGEFQHRTTQLVRMLRLACYLIAGAGVLGFLIFTRLHPGAISLFLKKLLN